MSDGLALKADVATTYSKDVVDGLFAEVPTNASVTSALAGKVNSADLETYKAVIASQMLPVAWLLPLSGRAILRFPFSTASR